MTSLNGLIEEIIKISDRLLQYNNGWLLAVILFIYLIFRDKIMDLSSNLIKLLYNRIYNSLAGNRFFLENSLRHYRKALVGRYNKLQIPFQSDRSFPMDDFYLPSIKMVTANNEQIEANNAIAKYHKLLILGPPGSGKSLLLKHIALTYAEGRLDNFPDNLIPIFLEFHRFSDSYQSLEQHLVAELAINDFPNAERFVSYSLKKGILMLLLDGFDEVKDSERAQVIQQIDELLYFYPKSRIIITCRTSSYKNELVNIIDQTLQIKEFSDEQIFKFLSLWKFLEPSSKSIEQLIQFLRDKPQIMALARNPLLLTIIALLYVDTHFVLPQSRVEFYNKSIDVLLRNRNVERNRFTAPLKQKVLEHLALFFQDSVNRRQKNKFGINYQTVISEIQKVLPNFNLQPEDASPLLKEIVERSGLLLSIDGGNSYQFAHLTFQEFFVASQLINDADGLIYRFQTDHDTWRETVKLWCGLTLDSTSFIRRIYEEDPITAFECLSDARKVDPKLSNDISNNVKALKARLGAGDVIKNTKIDFQSSSGFFINKENILSFKVSNLTKKSIQNILLELDDTPKYTVTQPKQKKHTLLELEGEDSQIIDYKIIVTTTGIITLQLKVNGEFYQPPLEIYGVMDNPYLYGPPIEDISNFYGREIELQTIIDNIQRSTPIHTMLIGEQRSGKTSMLYRLLERLKNPYIPIYISFSGIERNDKEALNWLLDKIIENLKEENLLNKKNYHISLKYSTDFTKILREIIQDIKAINKDYTIVLLLDEAHLMNEIDVKFQEVLRETFNQFIKDIRVVLACYYDFFDGLNVSGSPLQNIFEYKFLKPLDGDDLIKLIVEPAARLDYRYEEDAKDAIKKISGGHPYYTQFLCAESFREATNYNTRIISIGHVKVAENKVLTSDKQRFKMGFWKNMMGEERLFLKELVTRGNTNYLSKQVINRLKSKYILKESNDSLIFTATLFENWTKQLIEENI